MAPEGAVGGFLEIWGMGCRLLMGMGMVAGEVVPGTEGMGMGLGRKIRMVGRKRWGGCGMRFYIG
jgi:hypothetical protein